MPALVVGFGVVGACLLVPQVEQNRQVKWELDQLKAEQARVDEQIRVNDEFIKQVRVDPTLMSRLAQRQLRLMPEGTQVLEVKGVSGFDSRSPFQLTSVPAPQPVAAPSPVGGALLEPVRNGKVRLYLMGGALMLVAAGLVLDGPAKNSAKA